MKKFLMNYNIKFKIDLKNIILNILKTFNMWGTYYSITQIEILKIKYIEEKNKVSKSVSSSNQSN
jgi:hypothetical protein